MRPAAITSAHNSRESPPASLAAGGRHRVAVPFPLPAVNREVVDQYIRGRQKKEEHLQSEPRTCVGPDRFGPEEQHPGDDHHDEATDTPGQELPHDLGHRLLAHGDAEQPKIGNRDGPHGKPERQQVRALDKREHQ